MNHQFTRSQQVIAAMAKLKDLFRASIMVVGSRVMGGVIGFLLQVSIARFLGPEALGQYFLAISLLIVLAVVIGLGYPAILPRFAVGIKAGRDQTTDPALFFAQCRKDIIIAGIAISALGLTAVQILPGLTEIERICLSIGIATSTILALSSINTEILNAHKKHNLAYMPFNLFQPFMVFCLLFLMKWTIPDFNVIYLVAGHALIVISLYLFQHLKVSQFNRASSEGVEAAELSQLSQVSKQTKWVWRKHAMSMVIAILFINTFGDVDLITLGFLMDGHEIAIVGVCLKIALFLSFAIQAVHQLVIRDLADAIKHQERSNLNAVLLQANILSLVFSLGALAMVVIFGKQILMIFGEGFEAGYSCLVILMIGQVIRAFAGPSIQILALNSLEKRGLPIFISSFILLVLANVILVPLFQLTGAALAMVLVTTIWSVGLAIVAYHHTGIKTAIAMPFASKYQGTLQES